MVLFFLNDNQKVVKITHNIHGKINPKTAY